MWGHPNHVGTGEMTCKPGQAEGFQEGWEAVQRRDAVSRSTAESRCPGGSLCQPVTFFGNLRGLLVHH